MLNDKIISIILQDFDESFISSLLKSKDVYEIHIFDDLSYDSIKFIQLIVKLEDTFDIEFPDECLQMDSFSTIDQIINLVVDLQGRIINEQLWKEAIWRYF